MRSPTLACLVPLFAVACAAEPSPTADPRVDAARSRSSAQDPSATNTAPTSLEAPSPAASARPPSRVAEAARYDLKLDDAGLPELTRVISEITGKRFVLTGSLPIIKASLYAPEPVTAEEAYRAFLTVLASNGLTVVPRGRMFVIVPSPG